MSHRLTHPLRAVAAAAMVAVLMATLASPAGAASTVNFANGATGRCLQDSNGRLLAAQCNFGDTRGNPQYWTVSGYGDWTYRLQNQGTGRCLDMSSLGLRTFRATPPAAPMRSTSRGGRPL